MKQRVTDTDKEVIKMSVNGVTSTNGIDYDVYTASGTQKTDAQASTQDAAAKTDTGVVYEKSNETQTDSTKKTYKQNTELVSKLKADAQERTSQLRNLVQQLITKQGNAFGIANNDNSMWKFLASGNFTVDAKTKAQAQADIAEDGYWGVKQTSDRIIDFAKALSGGDPDKIEDMKKAFIKGYKQATGAWGKGNKMPGITGETYDAVMKKFDQWEEESKKQTTTKPVEDGTESQT